MLKRKIENQLLDWKKSKRNECLLVKGARQIGKTFSIRRFGKANYKSFVEINFEIRPELRSIFDGSLDVGEMLKRMSFQMPEVRFVPGETLFFFDEIQSCPGARTSLKSWAEDGRFDVVASGSLLGINYGEVSSFPVGYERQIEMNSLDFEEFLWASGLDERAVSGLAEYADGERPIDETVHAATMKRLREYMVVGGMPAAVEKFVETSNFGEADAVQRKILDGYLNDIAKYAGTADKPKARNCFLSLPRQLARENTKFKYSDVERGGTARKYGNALDWLRDANYVRYCRNVSTPEFPLASYAKEDQFRIYAGDIGLLTCMFGFETKKAILTDELKGPAKGGIYENLVADMLSKRGLPLYYWRKQDNTAEIDFLLERDARAVPLEIKSNRGVPKSMNSFLDRDEVKVAYKLSAQNAGRSGKKITLPLYMAMFL